MGHKVHPTGFRLGIIRDWEAKWYADRHYMEYLQEDLALRKVVATMYPEAGVSLVEIDRQANNVSMTIHTARPGILIGRGGQRVDEMRSRLETLIGKRVQLNIREVPQPELDAQLVAKNVCDQIERRIAYRRTLKQSLLRSMQAGAKGMRISIAGRLDGAEIARRVTMHEGQVPLHTLRADIDYGFSEARTTMGCIGVKVWLYKGDILPAPRELELEEAIPEPTVEAVVEEAPAEAVAEPAVAEAIVEEKPAEPVAEPAAEAVVEETPAEAVAEPAVETKARPTRKKRATATETVVEEKPAEAVTEPAAEAAVEETPTEAVTEPAAEAVVEEKTAEPAAEAKAKPTRKKRVTAAASVETGAKVSTKAAPKARIRTKAKDTSAAKKPAPKSEADEASADEASAAKPRPKTRTRAAPAAKAAVKKPKKTAEEPVAGAETTPEASENQGEGDAAT